MSLALQPNGWLPATLQAYLFRQPARKPRSVVNLWRNRRTVHERMSMFTEHEVKYAAAATWP